MKRIVHYIGLDVHKETMAGGDRTGGVARTDMLAWLARLRRKVWDEFLMAKPRATLADSLCPGLISFTPPGFRNGLRLVFDPLRPQKTGVLLDRTAAHLNG